MPSAAGYFTGPSLRNTILSRRDGIERLLFWWAYICREHRHVPGVAVAHDDPAEVSAGLFARDLAGAEQGIVARGPNGISGRPGVVRRDRFLGPARLHPAGERLFDGLASFDHGAGRSVEDTLRGEQSRKSLGIARVISRDPFGPEIVSGLLCVLRAGSRSRNDQND